ncbi:MAG: outer membrane lipoprotein-sorting protein [Candidatus Bipolaricaulia bacterium]
MKRITAVAAVGLMAIGLAALAQSDVSNKELLQTMDDVRFVDSDEYTMTIDIAAERPDESRQSTVKLFFKTVDGEERSRVEFLSPEDMVGQVYLNANDQTFFWEPGLATPINLSGNAKVFGDATVVQTVGIGLAEDYQVDTREMSTLDDGTEVLAVDTSATNDSVSFPTARVWGDPETLKPLKMRVFAMSGAPVNEVTFEEYATLGSEDQYVKTQVIQSLLQSANRTQLTITEINPTELSADLFNPDKLGSN